MDKAKTRLAHLPGMRSKSLKVERSLLRERAAEALREQISKRSVFLKSRACGILGAQA
jgi:hypothetical protein